MATNRNNNSYLDFDAENIFDAVENPSEQIKSKQHSFFNRDEYPSYLDREPLLDFDELITNADAETKIGYQKKSPDTKLEKKKGFPDDGFVHSASSSFFWAFTMTPLEISTIPVILVIEVIAMIFLWRWTSLINEFIGGFFGQLFGWIIFFGALYLFNFVVLKLTKVVWAFILTSRLIKKNDYEGE